MTITVNDLLVSLKSPVTSRKGSKESPLLTWWEHVWDPPPSRRGRAATLYFCPLLLFDLIIYDFFYPVRGMG